VQGLTTAAGIWTTSAIGVACGMGRSVTAIVSALLAWLVLSAVKQVIDPSPAD
jgi:putative Mg2+ transporter-C (MgtC) family protein